MTASSSDPGMGESNPSNELIINTESENYQKIVEKTRSDELLLNVNIANMYDDTLEVEWSAPLSGKHYSPIFLYVYFICLIPFFILTITMHLYDPKITFTKHQKCIIIYEV